MLLLELTTPHAQVGFWKDLLQLLQRLCVGEDDWNEAARQKALQQSSKGANRTERRAGKLRRLRERKAALTSFAHLETGSARRSNQSGGEPGWHSVNRRKASYGAAAARAVRKGQTWLPQLKWLP